MKCEQCGEELKQDDKFCSKCGNEVLHLEKVAVNLTNQEKVAIFIGTNKDYFIWKWYKGSSWNWAGFFLTFYWLAYRKLYKPLFIIFGISIFVTILLYLLLPKNLYIVTSLIGLWVNIYVGIKGNHLYKNHLNRKLEEIDSTTSSYQEKIERIRETGGTSFTGVFAVMGVGILISIIYATTFFKDDYFNHTFDFVDFYQEEVEFGTVKYGVLDEKKVFNSNDEIIMRANLKEPVGDSEIEFKLSRFEDGYDILKLSWSTSINPSSNSFEIQVVPENSDLEPGQYTLVILNTKWQILAKGSFIVK